MANDLEKNVKEIRDEARQMLNTIKKVRGKRYSDAVQTLLLIKQVADISFMLCSIVSDEREDLAQACGSSLEHCLSEIGCNFAKLTNFETDEWSEIVRDANALSDSVSHLLRSAVAAHQGGSDFGGS